MVQGFFSDFLLLLNSLPKELFSYTKQSECLVSIELTPHTCTHLRETLCFFKVVCSPPSQSRWVPSFGSLFTNSRMSSTTVLEEEESWGVRGGEVEWDLWSPRTHLTPPKGNNLDPPRLPLCQTARLCVLFRPCDSLYGQYCAAYTYGGRMEALLLSGFSWNRDEELQAAGGQLQNSYLAGIGMCVFNHGHILMKQKCAAAQIFLTES